jgi:transcriptional regulator with XRE-family HTH domain
MEKSTAVPHSGRMEDLKTHIAAVFRAARLRKKLTQEALAGVIDVSVETISNTERGDSLVSLPVFLRLAATLEVDLAEIITPPKVKRRKISTHRIRLEQDLLHLGEQMTDSELELTLGIGRLVRLDRGRQD